MKSIRRELARKWGFLKTQDGFRKAPLLAAIRLISWRARCSLRKATVVNLRRWNVQMFLPPHWRGLAKRVFAFRENYEAELIYLERLLSPGSIFIDVGANIGIYTLVASKLVGERGRVIAFEPSAQSFPLLQQNIALNGSKNVSAFPMALSNSAGKAWLYHPGIPDGNSLGRDPSWGNDAEEVPTETLDDIVEQNFLKRVDVIKIDVEGAEELVLRGGRKVVASKNPVIIFEFWPEGPSLLGLSLYGAWNFLAGLGYRFFNVCSANIASRIESPPTDTMYANVLAIHPDNGKVLDNDHREQPEKEMVPASSPGLFPKGARRN